MTKKKNFVYLLSRGDSSQSLIAFDIDTILEVLKNEINIGDKNWLLNKSYKISFKEMSNKELDNIDEDGFEGF